MNLTVRQELMRLMNQLDGIKFDLYASVYTLTDDEFETVYFVRDSLHEIIKEMEWENK